MSQQMSDGTDAQSEIENTGDANLNALVQGLTSAINELSEEIDSLSDLEAAGTDELVHLFAALKDMEDNAEDFRKGDVSDALETRIEIGDKHDTGVISLSRIQSHRKFVFDDGKTLKTLTAAGIDPSPAVSLNASKTSDLLEDAGIDDSDHVGESEYEYFRSY